MCVSVCTETPMQTFPALFGRVCGQWSPLGPYLVQPLFVYIPIQSLAASGARPLVWSAQRMSMLPCV